MTSIIVETRVYDLIRAHPGITQIGLRRSLPKINSTAISKACTSLCRGGLICHDGNNPHAYFAVILEEEKE